MGRLAQARNAVPAGARLPGDIALGRPRRRWKADRQKGDHDPESIPLTVPEVRRLTLAMTEPEEEQSFRLGWSMWRRTHQAVAKRCHAAARRALRREGALVSPKHPVPTASIVAEAAPLTTKLTARPIGNACARSCRHRSRPVGDPGATTVYGAVRDPLGLE